MLKNIPKKRIVLYAIILGALPLVFCLAKIWGKQGILEELSNEIELVETKAMNYKYQQSANQGVISFYKNADHFYIDKYIETLNFLEPEVEALQKIVNDKNFTGDNEITRRLETLTGPANRIVFTEGMVQTYPLYQETTETLTHPVEVDVEDIKKILSRVEGVEIGSYKPGPNLPQLIVLDFKLDKKKNSDNEVFLLNLRLLKREYQ